MNRRPSRCPQTGLSLASLAGPVACTATLLHIEIARATQPTVEAETLLEQRLGGMTAALSVVPVTS